MKALTGDIIRHLSAKKTERGLYPGQKTGR